MLEGEVTALDVLCQALSHCWIDEPAVARQAEPAKPPRTPEGRAAAASPGVAELRELLERPHALGHAISDTLDRMNTKVAQAKNRQERSHRELSDAEARRQHAQQVIDDYDQPFGRDVAVATDIELAGTPTKPAALFESTLPSWPTSEAAFPGS